MTNKQMLSVELRVLGKAPLGERYYLCECPKCGLVGSSEECTQDEVLCLQKAGDDRCYGEADEIDAARLLELMQSGAFEKPGAQHQGEPVARFHKSPVKKHVSIDLLRTDLKHGQLLYAEQTAPVAHTMLSIMEAVEASKVYTMLTSDQCHALAQVLNGVKP